MGIIWCAACEGKVSDKLDKCPHCGNPINAKGYVESSQKQAKTVKKTHMNKTQKVLILLLILAVIGMCLCPPWIQKPWYGVGLNLPSLRGYRLITEPPAPIGPYASSYNCEINKERLIIQFLLTGVLFGGLIFIFRTHREANMIIKKKRANKNRIHLIVPGCFIALGGPLLVVAGMSSNGVFALSLIFGILFILIGIIWYLIAELWYLIARFLV